MPPHLALYLLGSPKLDLDHAPIAVDRRKALALLAYLVMNREPHTRNFISALFWPEYDQAKAFTNLRHTLWETQQIIGEGWIIADRETIKLNEDASIWLDVAQFESLVTESRAQSDVSLRISLLADTVKIYRNHFLTGFSLKDAPTFNEWAFAESENLRHQLASALTMLSDDYCSLGQAETAIPHAQRLITLDSLNEASHRQLMQVYIQAGQHNAALKQYQTCEQILRKELGVDPQPETRELYKKIRKGEFKSNPTIKQKNTDESQHNIPFQVSKFIGREKELDEITKLVADHRLVTLVGTGGIGKTRLSLKVGAGLLNQYINGIWFVELASLSDPVLVPQTVAKLFNILEQAGESLTEKLIRTLHQKNTLLIFDNCEHLIDACAQLADALLKNCPNLKIIATSREPLRINGEAQYHVPSFALPDIQQLLDQLLRYESVQLFEERARLVQEKFSLTIENVSSIAQICHRLDGIPLAIELAAARVNILSTQQIAARLDESLSLLTSGNRTTMPRHQTLRASIDWSWSLLSEAEQILLRRLSVFSGGWILEGAVEVCDSDVVKEWDVLDLLNNLVEKSLVLFDSENERYNFLETIRQYAYEEFQKTDEMVTTHSRHSAWLLTWAKRIGPELRGRDQVVKFKQVAFELDNIRAAVNWGLDNGQAETSMKVVIALTPFWDSNNPYRESRQWLERGISLREHISKITLAETLAVAGWFAFRQNDPKVAAPYFEESLALAKELDNQSLIAYALRGLGVMQFLIGDFAKAEPFFEEAILLYQNLGEKRGLAIAVGNKAQAFIYQSNLSAAIQLLEDHLGILDDLDDLATSAYFQFLLGGLKVLQGDLDDATTLLKNSLLVYSQINYVLVIGNCLIAFAGAANGYKNPIRATCLLGARETIHELIGTNLDLGFQSIYTSILDQTRAMLSESDFATAWAEGRAMTLDKAVEYALDETRN